jgi:replication fork clamp-binding protein CrfC
MIGIINMVKLTNLLRYFYRERHKTSERWNYWDESISLDLLIHALYFESFEDNLSGVL